MSHRCAIDVAHRNGALHLRVSGEIDMASAGTLLDAIVSAEVPPGGRITLDLSGVAFMDSAGLSALVEAHRKHDGDGVEMTIVEAPRSVRKLFSLSGVDAYLRVDGPQAGPHG